MILSRRKAHFYATVSLAAMLPIIFLAGLLLRPTIPAADSSADKLFADANFSTDSPDLDRSTLLVEKEIQVLAEVIPETDESALLALTPQAIIPFSDVLVYWQQGEPSLSETDGETISEDNVLIGQLAGDSRRRLRLPVELQGQKGHLILYSRSQDTLIASFPFTLAPRQP